MRQANVTNLHRDRYVAGPAKLSLGKDDLITAESSYALYQSDVIDYASDDRAAAHKRQQVINLS